MIFRLVKRFLDSLGLYPNAGPDVTRTMVMTCRRTEKKP